MTVSKNRYYLSKKILKNIIYQVGFFFEPPQGSTARRTANVRTGSASATLDTVGLLGGHDGSKPLDPPQNVFAFAESLC